ncbi:unnamed protein product, partial [Laminaria digitata]
KAFRKKHRRGSTGCCSIRSTGKRGEAGGRSLGNYIAAAPILLCSSSLLELCSSIEHGMQQAEAGRERCLDALSVALSQESDDKRWYTSRLQLQLASLQLCILCRTRGMFLLTVGRDTPARLW